MLAGKPNL